MNNLMDLLAYLYPDATPHRDYQVTDFGNGPVITYWNTQKLGPQPSLATLSANTLEPAKKRKRIQLVLAFDVEYDALWQVAGVEIGAIKDRILFKAAANRTAAENQKVTSAAALIDKIETKLAAVSSATTEAEVEAITW